jgi:hypothetical protein
LLLILPEILSAIDLRRACWLQAYVTTADNLLYPLQLPTLSHPGRMVIPFSFTTCPSFSWQSLASLMTRKLIPAVHWANE